MNLDPDLTPYTKTNFKWFIELNKTAKIIQLLEENISEGLGGTGLGKEFSQCKKIQTIKYKLFNWTSSTWKSLILQKTRKEIRQASDREQHLQTYMIKDLYHVYLKNS